MKGGRRAEIHHSRTNCEHVHIREDLFVCHIKPRESIFNVCVCARTVRSHLAPVSIFHYKTEPVVGLEGIFQCLQEKKSTLKGTTQQLNNKNHVTSNPGGESQNKITRQNKLRFLSHLL